MDLEGLKWRRIAAVLGAAALTLAAGGALFVWSGVYNIAASTDHFGQTTWLLQKVREQSIAAQSSSINPPQLDDVGMIRLGASHYAGVCVPCHGWPGDPINPIVGGMLPPPPDLGEALERRPVNEIFWIVKNGLKYTGMPAWPAQKRDDEVWAVTAFLSQLPPRRDDFFDLARLREEEGNEPVGVVLSRCTRCHEGDGAPTNGDRIPRLAGQTEDYLLRSLREYKTGVRGSGAMEPVAFLLSERQMSALASHFARLPTSDDRPQISADIAPLKRGETIATHGLTDQKVPACNACHSGRRSRQFPALAGQHAEYIAEQLLLWKRGGRMQTAYGRIMGQVARPLTEAQVRDVAAYFASLPVPMGDDSIVEAR